MSSQTQPADASDAVRTGDRRQRIFAAPIVLGIVSAIGLASALIGDGPWDMLSWITLGAPLAVIAIYGRRRTI